MFSKNKNQFNTEYNYKNINNITSLTGIYKIHNLINNHCYVGSASTKGRSKSISGIRKRISQHFNYLENNKHNNIHLQRAWNKYGKENFEFHILALCPSEYCIKLEQWFLDELMPEYNICTVANSCLGVKRSEETKLKISNSNKGRVVTWGYKIGYANRKENNPERAKILSKALKGKKMSPEARISNRDKRRHHKSITKLTIQDVIDIKKYFQDGERAIDIVKKYNVAYSTIMDIKHNRTFKDILL